MARRSYDYEYDDSWDEPEPEPDEPAHEPWTPEDMSETDRDNAANDAAERAQR